MIEINFNWSIVDCEQSVFSHKIRRVLRRGAFWHRERFKPKGLGRDEKIWTVDFWSKQTLHQPSNGVPDW